MALSVLTLGPSVTPCSLVVDTRDTRVLTLGPSVTSWTQRGTQVLTLGACEPQRHLVTRRC